MNGSATGIVVIGRNEGDRLAACLRSCRACSQRVVFADSASTDGSSQLAEGLGVATVVLDESAPLTAARGRNAGFKELRSLFPDCEFVQFVDGDCVLSREWFDAAEEFLRMNPEVAAVCGRRYEAHPDGSIYNRMFEEEWNTSVGEALSCGGDAMVRVSAFEQVGGFRSEIKAGEEPELCSRLRAAGWRIWRLDLPMTQHDADMHHLWQWWRRALRSGFGYAQVWSSTRSGADPLYARQLASAVFWALAVPVGVLFTAIAADARLLLLLPLIYAFQVGRLAAREGLGSLHSWKRAALVMIAKFAEVLGAASYWLNRQRHRPIEYKRNATPSVGAE